jgi:hypothetical protein
MEQLIKDSLKISFDYLRYRKLTAELAEVGQTTGPNQTESLIFYTKLNNQRMNRLDKTLLLTDEFMKVAESISCDLIWLVLTERWGGDAAQILPVLNKVAVTSSNIEMKLLLRDNNLELMDNFLTNGGRSIPKLIILDKDTLQLKGSWGPRPKPAQDMFEVYKTQKDKIAYKDFQAELQKWYLKDKALTIQEELLEFLNTCN